MYVNQQVIIIQKGDCKGMHGRVVRFIGDTVVVEIEERGKECVYYTADELKDAKS